MFLAKTGTFIKKASTIDPHIPSFNEVFINKLTSFFKKPKNLSWLNGFNI